MQRWQREYGARSRRASGLEVEGVGCGGTMGRWEMGQNVMGDVIPGCRGTLGGDVAARWWYGR